MKISVENSEKSVELFSFDEISDVPGLYTYKHGHTYHRVDFFVVTSDGKRLYVHPKSKSLLLDGIRSPGTKCLVRLEEKLVLDFGSL